MYPPPDDFATHGFAFIPPISHLLNYTTSHEHNVTPTGYRDIRRDTLLDLPLTFSWPDGTCAAITEAALRRYAGMSLLRPSGEQARDDLVCQLTPWPDGTKVVRPLPMRTPWRVVLIGDRPGALLESETIYCFDNPNPMLADYPAAYEGEPGFDFLELVPTWWDETRVLAGQIGELLVTARRKGSTWYLGGMSAKGPRELALGLSFLGPGQ